MPTPQKVGIPPNLLGHLRDIYDEDRKRGTNTMKDDVALVAAALSGGPEKFSPIIERYQGVVFAVALARLGNFHDAEDIAQEVFVEAFKHLDRLSDPSRLGAWLRSIAIHRCIGHLRKCREVINVQEIVEQVEDISSNPHTQMERQELRDQVMAAIGQLSKKQRETTTLFYINDYSQEEIARIQEVPIGTVKRRLYDARGKLKEEMIGLVEDVLKSGAPKEDFGERVFDILSRYQRPAVPWQKWDEIESELRQIGTQGLDGFMKALESPHSRTRIFALRMLHASGLSDEAFEELLKKLLADPNRKVRKMAFMTLFYIMLNNESKRERLMPHFLSFLTDRSKKVRGVLWYVCHVGDLPKYIPMERVMRAFLDEKDPGFQRGLADLMRAILDAHEDQKDKE
jgi:RNA polymerase sigma-70 factor (ECF subfamily)